MVATAVWAFLAAIAGIVVIVVAVSVYVQTVTLPRLERRNRLYEYNHTDTHKGGQK